MSPSCTIASDQWANSIEDLGSYDGPVINSHLVFTTMNNKARGDNHSVDQQLVSHRGRAHRIIGPYCQAI